MTYHEADSISSTPGKVREELLLRDTRGKRAVVVPNKQTRRQVRIRSRREDSQPATHDSAPSLTPDRRIRRTPLLV